MEGGADLLDEGSTDKKMNNNTIVTIGRGTRTSGERLSDTSWTTFRAIVTEMVSRRTGGPLLFTGDGDGIWEDEFEEAFTVISMGYGGDQLEVDLRILAGWYDQDAIAVTVGRPSLVGPRL